MIDQEYRTDSSKRVLVGHSIGGMFAIYAMLREPRLFRSHVAASPAIHGYEIFELEAEFAKKHKQLPAQLYLGVGDLDETVEDPIVSDVFRFGLQLERRKYKGLSITKQVFADNNHSEVVAPAFQAGLRLALAK